MFIENIKPRQLIRSFLHGDQMPRPLSATSDWHNMVMEIRKSYQESVVFTAPIPTHSVPLAPEVFTELSPQTSKNVTQNKEIKKVEQLYLYKGINPSAFRYYFENNAITPGTKNGESPWITSNLNRALEHANTTALAGNRTCLAVIDKQILQQGNLTLSHSATSLLSGHYYDYFGPEQVTWDHIKAIFVTRNSLNEVYHHYLNSQNSEVDWNNVAAKMKVVQPGEVKDIRDQLPFLR